MDRRLRVLVSAGGTGGHIFPAIAVAQHLRDNYGAEVLFVGAKDRMETEIVPKYGFPIKTVWISGLQRTKWWDNILLPIKMFVSIIQAYNIISDFKPDVIFSLGAYVSVPVVWGRFANNIPVVLHEQNAVPGLAVRLLAPKASVITLVLPAKELEKYNHVYTGNPVRQSILNYDKIPRSEALEYFGLEDRPTVLVTGGSLGSAFFNQIIAEEGEKILQKGYQIIWQTGKQEVPQMKWNPEEWRGRVWQGQFIDRMDYAYRVADVVVSRAGASALSELAVAGKPAVIVPSPNVADDHQRKNAESLAQQGAIVMVEEHEKDKLIPTVLELLGDESRRQALAERIKQFGNPQATERIAEIIVEQAKKYSDELA
ncbi:MAG: undecaprenyldiphospho-muramoylpentapeptide beta-N-acetylglucosaminyltransferase [Chlorobi bacterium]|nr:undecaprenyldiphospho-muramoylpentapeptide beta-N-acetylglucosaminyltransferase [Chlorobiota bacterium]